jgi:hypothetical protein
LLLKEHMMLERKLQVWNKPGMFHKLLQE